MTKTTVHPGICNLVSTVVASSEDGMDVTLHVTSACEAVTKMMTELGKEFDAFDICLKKPGENVFYEYAAKHFPGHAGCPAICGIIKCAEVECKLALPHNVEIVFENTHL